MFKNMYLFIQTIGCKITNTWNHSGFQKYLQNAGWLFFGRIFGMVISFFVTAYVVRYLGPEQFGMLSYAISFTGLFSFVAGLGVDSMLYRDLVDKPEMQNSLLGTAFWLKLSGGLLAFVSVLAFLPFLNNTKQINQLIIIIAASFVFQSLNIINLFFQAKVVSKIIAINFILVTLFLSAIKLVLVLLSAKLVWFGVIILAESIIYGIGYFYFYKRSKELINRWVFDKQLAKKMLIFSWPLILASAFVLVFNRIDQVMIKHLMNVGAVGLYDAAVRIAEIWYFVPSIIVSSIFPAIVNAKKSGYEVYKRRLMKLSLVVVGCSTVIALPIYLLAPILIKFLYGTSFGGATTVLRIYVWAGIGAALGGVINNYLIIENKTKTIFLINFFAMSTNVGLNLYLIPRFGINGAAYATLVSYSLIPILGILMNFRYFSWKQLSLLR